MTSSSFKYHAPKARINIMLFLHTRCTQER
ncbi:hypothetical protein KPSA1_04889 [Pseudomonas syringae pv. actinidiae]|uniref:Uncharacterized protein n=1 Tax=Pseudomonas syringae pv. actinidiae TaxID=103796 RepID=A0A2V0QLE3_PSESF|nr:hypothetical protein KPSA1_04889 [Pseudomonas syringae pv. actinidiae]